MIKSDWMFGVALGLLFAPLFGMVGSLVVMVTSKPERYDPSAPLVTKKNMRDGLLIAVAVFPVFLLSGASLSQKDRASAATWERYVRDHKCAVADSRTRTVYNFNPVTKMNQATTTTEYLWRCDNGEQWHP